jgi:hypothetical protein
MLDGIKAAVARIVDVTGRLHALMEAHTALTTDNAAVVAERDALKTRVAELEAQAGEVASVQADAEKAAADLESLVPAA